MINGNINTYLESKRDLDPPIWASKIRFFPYSYHKRTVCMRVELYGCRWIDGVVSYTMPQGDKRGSNWEFYDSAYDGLWNGDELKGGLGQLIDGKFGHDDFKSDFYDSSQSWVGWKNDTRSGRPVEIKFEFDKVREFSAVHIYCNNQFTKDVQVFQSVKIMFSVGGKRFNRQEPVTYEYIEDKIFEIARNVSIKLHHRIGKFVKLQLHFAAKWIMVSEVAFDSTIAHGNFTPEPEINTPNLVKLNKDKNIKEHTTEVSLPAGKIYDPKYLAIIVIMVIIVIICGLIFFIYNKYRSQKLFCSPNTSDLGFTSNTLQNIQPKFGLNEKEATMEAYGVSEIDSYRRSHGTLKASLQSTLPLPHPGLYHVIENNDYQEPYQALKYAPYCGYSSVVMEMQDVLINTKTKSPSGIAKNFFHIVHIGFNVFFLIYFRNS